MAAFDDEVGVGFAGSEEGFPIHGKNEARKRVHPHGASKNKRNC